MQLDPDMLRSLTAQPAPAAAEDGPATPEQWAAMTFEPWTFDPDALPTNEEWAGLADPHLSTLRVAQLICCKSKSELQVSIVDLGDEAMFALIERLSDAQKLFETLASFADCAMARLVCAGCAAATAETP